MITSGVLGIATSSIAVWSARQNANLARENRTYQRLAESYLEVLRLVEREGQWVEECMSAPFPRSPANTPPEPVVTARATIAAHLAAFGSENVRSHYQSWRSTITDIERTVIFSDQEVDNVYEAAKYGLPLRQEGLNPVEYLMQQWADEVSARQALADTIAEELGRHRPAAARWWNLFHADALFRQIFSHHERTR